MILSLFQIILIETFFFGILAAMFYLLYLLKRKPCGQNSKNSDKKLLCDNYYGYVYYNGQKRPFLEIRSYYGVKHLVNWKDNIRIPLNKFDKLF